MERFRECRRSLWQKCQIIHSRLQRGIKTNSDKQANRHGWKQLINQEAQHSKLLEISPICCINPVVCFHHQHSFSRPTPHCPRLALWSYISLQTLLHKHDTCFWCFFFLFFFIITWMLGRRLCFANQGMFMHLEITCGAEMAVDCFEWMRQAL